MMSTAGLYGHIRSNNVKSALLLAGFVVLVAMLWLAGTLLWAVLSTKFQAVIIRLENREPTAEELVSVVVEHWIATAAGYAFIPLVAVSGWFAYAFAAHRRLIQDATGARAISRHLDFQLYNMVENLSITAGLPMPRVEIMETSALNAYAAGLGPESATVAVTRGLLERLTPDELEAVLAHEITHIKNRDVRLMVIATIFVGGLTYGSQMMRRQSSPDGALGRSMAGAEIISLVIACLIAALASLFGVLTRFAISRTREYLADAGAVELTKNPDALISALRKVSAGDDEVAGLPASLRAMMISSHLEGLFATHPPMEARIRALEVHAGGRRDVARPAHPAAVQGVVGPARRPAQAPAGSGGAARPFGRRTARAGSSIVR